MDDYIFCHIVAGEAPAYFVYKDDLVVAFLSLEQPNPYKVLVIPRSHVETIFDLDDELAAAIFQATVEITRGVRGGFRMRGFEPGAIQRQCQTARGISFSSVHHPSL